MSQEDEIPKWKQAQFTTNVAHLLQQRGSRLRGRVSLGSYKGKSAEVVKQFGETAAVESVGRNEDTPIMSTPRDQRWVYPKKVHWGDLIDAKDLAEQLLDPTSGLAVAASNAMGRAFDTSLIVPNFFGDVKTGIDGGTTTAFPAATQDVAQTVGSANGATDVGMNVDKFIDGLTLLLGNEAEIETEDVNIALTAKDIRSLMKDVKFTSRDYRDKYVLDGKTGMLMSFLGVNIVHSEKLGLKTGTTYRANPMWCASGMHLGLWEDLQVKMAPDPSKQFNQRIYMYWIAGATRIEEKKIVRILNLVA